MNIKELLSAQLNKTKNKHTRKLQEVGSSKKSSSKTTRDPSATAVKRILPSIGGDAGQFEESVVDLETIYNAYSSDGYISRAIDMISGLMFKSGYEIKGRNNESLEYIKTRIALIEESTNLSFDEFITELGDNFVLYSNAPFVKTRGQENLAGLQATGYYGGDPISGIFPINPRYFKPMQDEFGNVESYEVSNDGSETVEFNTEDIAHLTYRKPTGTLFGTPYIHNVLDDVLILRNIEENVSQLIYRNLFPLTTYTIGNIKEGYEATDQEIEETAAKLQEMRLDEIHVIPERHKIETIGAQNAVLDVSQYLAYFRQRVFTGLGMSESVMGISGTSNKSTADNQNSDLNDVVKDYQRRFQTQIQHYLINELLFEGGYDPILNPEYQVEFKFIEIEQTAKMAKENHLINLFNNYAISFDELREGLGREPQEDISRFRHILFGETSNNAENTTDSLDQPENQSGKQASPSKETTKEKKNEKNRLTESFEVVRFPMLEHLYSKNKGVLAQWLDMKSQLYQRTKANMPLQQAVITVLGLNQMKMADSIYRETIDALNATLSEKTALTLSESKKINEHIFNISQSVSEKLCIAVEERMNKVPEKIVATEHIEVVFASLEKRVTEIVHFQQAYGKNIGQAKNLFDEGYTVLQVEAKQSDCKKCQTKTLHKEASWWEEIPPCHLHCQCSIQTKKE